MKLYHNGTTEGWQIPGQQDKKAERIDVPSSPADLAAWLNHRRVGPSGATAEQERREESADVAAGGAVLTAADVDQVNERRPTFLGPLSAEEIERHRIAAGQCPKCGNTALYLRSLDETAVCEWLETAELERIQRVVEHARAIVRERGAALEPGAKEKAN
jgi:hypothetical protein